MARSIDHSAVLLPGGKRRGARASSVSWARFFFVFLYVTVTACAIVLLGLSWRSELHRRHVAEAASATSGTALRTAKARVSALDERNKALTTRAAGLTHDLKQIRNQSSRRGAAVRDTRSVLRATETFVAALDGLDQTVSDTVDAEKALARLQARLAAHLKGLDDYLRVTPESALDRPLLRARLRALTRDLAALQGIIARLTEGTDPLKKAVEPLGQTGDLDRSLRSALTRARAALRR